MTSTFEEAALHGDAVTDTTFCFGDYEKQFGPWYSRITPLKCALFAANCSTIINGNILSKTYEKKR